MNKSILIVICDFIVLSVLSLSTGQQMTDSNGAPLSNVVIDTKGYSQIISELVQKHKSLDEAAAEMEKIRKELGLKKSVLADVNRELAQKSKQIGQLQSSLEEHAGTEKKLGNELYYHTKELKQISQEYDKVKKRYQGTLANLSATKTELIIIRKNLAERDQQLKTKEKQLKSAEKNVSEREMQLLRHKTREQVVAVTLTKKELEAEELRKKLEAAKEELSYARGRLSVTEKELSSTKTKLNTTSKKLTRTETELASAKVELGSVKEVLGSAVTDLSSTKKRLDKTETKLEGTSQELDKTEKQLVQAHTAIDSTVAELTMTRDKLTEAQKKTQNSILNKYSLSAAKFSIQIIEKKFLLFDNQQKYAIFLPKVKVGDKNYLVTDFYNAFGMRKTRRDYGDVDAVNYFVTWNLAGSPKAKRLSGDILASKTDPRVCLVQCPKESDDALDILYYNELKSRGLQGIFLIKKDGFGQQIADLRSRCSLGLSKGGNYLYIRNPKRKSQSELKAELGDVVMSRDGKFIGVIVEVDRPRGDAPETAKCFVFNQNFNIGQNYKIPLEKKTGGEFYLRFAQSVNALRTRIKDFERK